MALPINQLIRANTNKLMFCKNPLPKAIFFTLLLFFAALNNSYAQEIYSWKRCIELTLQNNNELKSALASEESIKASLGSAISNFLPQLTANGTSTRSMGGSVASSTGAVSVSVGGSNAGSSISNTNTMSLSATQNLFSGFQDYGRIKQSEANIAAAKANIALVKAKISRDLKVAYQGFLYAKEYSELLKDIINRREYNLSVIKLRFKGGMENKGSLLLAEAYLGDAKYNLIQAQNLKEVAKAQLCRVMNLSECENFDISDNIPTKKPLTNINFYELVKDTPQHAQALAQEQASKAGVTIAESGFFPSLNLSGAVGRRGSEFLPQGDYWSVGANLSFPFFTGGRDYYAMEGALASNSSAKYNKENIDLQTLADLKQSYSFYVESVTKLEVSKAYKDASQMRADIARKKYSSGLLIFENWDAIENDLINRQTAYLQSKRDRVINEVNWEQTQGKGVLNQ